LDRAGWHTSTKWRVPTHVHLLFLPPYAPELQPTERLWPLTNTTLANRHFATINNEIDITQTRHKNYAPSGHLLRENSTAAERSSR
jgi:transposase